MTILSGKGSPQPGWAEVILGLVTFAVLLFAFAMAFALLPQNPVLQGVVGSTAGGVAGVGAFAAAVALRIRALPPFGFTSAFPRWLGIAAALGFVAYGLTYVVQLVYASSFAGDDPQGILHAAARGGPLPFAASLIGGAVFTPFGEEALFRGVVSNSLNRYGAWASIGASSVIFGLAHGVSVILPVAVIVGALAAIVFRRTGSIWPCVVLHGVYNGLNSFASAWGLSPAQ